MDALKNLKNQAVSGFNQVRNYDYNKTIQDTLAPINDAYTSFKNIWNSFFFTDKVGLLHTKYDETGNVVKDKEGRTIKELFNFDIRKQETLKLSADITDYVVEDNSTVNNNITLKPEIFTFTGTIGDNVIKAPKRTKVSSFVQKKLNPLTALSPKLTTQAQQYLDTFNKISAQADSIVNSVGGALDYMTNLAKEIEPNQKKQVATLIMLFKKRELMTAATDFYALNNVVIQDLSINSVEETTGKIEITMTLKHINFATRLLVQKKQGDGRNAIQTSEVVNKGKTTGKELDKSFLLKTGEFIFQ